MKRPSFMSLARNPLVHDPAAFRTPCPGPANIVHFTQHPQRQRRRRRRRRRVVVNDGPKHIRRESVTHPPTTPSASSLGAAPHPRRRLRRPAQWLRAMPTATAPRAHPRRPRRPRPQPSRPVPRTRTCLRTRTRRRAGWMLSCGPLANMWYVSHTARFLSRRPI